MAIDGNLSKRSRRWLAGLRARSIIHQQFECRTSLNSLQEVLDWCDQQELSLGRNGKSNYFIVSREAIATIDRTLQGLGFPPLDHDYRQQSRSQTVVVDPNEKNAGINPTAWLLLVAVNVAPVLAATREAYFAVSGFKPAQTNMEIDVRYLDLLRFSQLVVVENRDSFNDWHRYDINNALQQALVIYRGDKGHSRACKTLLKRWAREKPAAPAVYFGDFDLAGLRLAVSGLYQAWLLPERAWLAAHLVTAHYPDSQARYLQRLASECPNGWQPLMELMTTNRAGLRQQGMFNTPLCLYHRSVLP